MTALELLESGGWTWVKGRFGLTGKRHGCLVHLLLASSVMDYKTKHRDVLAAISVLFPERACTLVSGFNDHEKTTEADVRRVLKVAGA